jgi:hypothetical protein
MGQQHTARTPVTRTINAVKVIGLGGIGAVVSQALVQFLASQKASYPLYFIDGDRYEERNRERVLFQSYDNKAVAKAREFSSVYSDQMTIVPERNGVKPCNKTLLSRFAKLPRPRHRAYCTSLFQLHADIGFQNGAFWEHSVFVTGSSSAV